MTKLMREEMSWEKLEPMYYEIYQKALTQDEVDGMVAFYKTKAGQALVKKMPGLMQEVMTSVQAKLGGPMMSKVQAIAQELEEELKTAMSKEQP
jgi:hypothetical protein